jgi:hypothetical protein
MDCTEQDNILNFVSKEDKDSSEASQLVREHGEVAVDLVSKLMLLHLKIFQLGSNGTVAIQIAMERALNNNLDRISSKVIEAMQQAGIAAANQEVSTILTEAVPTINKDVSDWMSFQIQIELTVNTEEIVKRGFNNLTDILEAARAYAELANKIEARLGKGAMELFKLSSLENSK